MSELEKARQIINATDREIARLFEQRMDAVRQVAEHKTVYGLPKTSKTVIRFCGCTMICL